MIKRIALSSIIELIGIFFFVGGMVFAETLPYIIPNMLLGVVIYVWGSILKAGLKKVIE